MLPAPKCQDRVKRRRNLILRDKLRILELLGRGETRDNVASEYAVPDLGLGRQGTCPGASTKKGPPQKKTIQNV